MPGYISTGRYEPKVVGFDLEIYAKLIEKDSFRQPCLPECETDTESESSDDEQQRSLNIGEKHQDGQIDDKLDLVSVSDKTDII